MASSADGLSLLMVEHDVASVLALSSRIFVLNFGELIAQGTPDEVRSDPAVREAYLGRRGRHGGRGGGSGGSWGRSRVRRRGPAGRFAAAMSEPMLAVEDLDVSYGASQALFGVSLEVEAGSLVAVLGANGAGKSTLARTVSGLVPSIGGSVRFDGIDITKRAAYKLSAEGLTHIPEGRGIFPGLSVLENLRMAVGQLTRGERSAAIDRAIELFPVLGERRRQGAGTLSGGEQQMLALARALAVTPKLIIADEMSLGLAPMVAEEVFRGLDEARKSGITVVLIEQFVHRALALADSCVILTRGRVGWSGPASEAHDEVIERYLGEAAPSE